MSHKLVQKVEVIERICQLHVEGMNDTAIGRCIQVEHPGDYPTLNYKHIKKTRIDPENKELITRHREVYLGSVMEVPISQKRIRLDDLDRERQRIIKTVRALCGDKELEDGSITIESVPIKKEGKYLSLIKRLVELEIAGRDEVEKKPDLMDMFARVGPLSKKTDEELMAYERRLTIELTAYQSGAKIQRAISGKAGRFEGVQETPEV